MSNTKQILHTFLQKHRKSLPKYECIIVGESHCPKIGCRATLFDGQVFEVACNYTKRKDAEDVVAILMYEECISKFPKANTKNLVSDIKRDINYKGQLQEICMQNNYATPQYTTSKRGSSHMPQFNTKVKVLSRAGVVIVTAESNTFYSKKKQSERCAAKLAIDFIIDLLSINLSCQYNSKSQLIQYTELNNMHTPVYKYYSKGKSHELRWKVNIFIPETSISYKSLKFCDTKKGAETDATIALLNILEQEEYKLHYTYDDNLNASISNNLDDLFSYPTQDVFDTKYLTYNMIQLNNNHKLKDIFTNSDSDSAEGEEILFKT